jgi:ABC-2 type transport system permease protein
LGMQAPRPSAAPVPLGSELLLAAGLLSMLLMMTSRALAGAVQSLYTRGDLDLLLSSPVDRRAIIGVRLGSLALAVALEVALLIFPFANVFVLFGHFAWFKAYLLVPGMAMLASSIGIWVTLLSFRTIGPRRTRVVVQVFAVLVGMAMMLAFYLPQMLQHGRRAGPFDGTIAMLARSPGGFRYLLATPAHWILQGFQPTLLFLAAATGLAALTVYLAGEPIVRSLTAITGGVTRRRRASGTGTVQFHRSFRVMVVLKELKLIARDPFLIAQILRQSLLVLPMAFVLWRNRSPGGLPLPWLAVIWLAAGLAGPLSWLTILAEDAPDLLAVAPVTRATLVRAKLEAAMLPTLPVCALPLFALLPTRPWFAVCVSASAFGAALSNALINMRNPVAQRRDSFKTRHRGSGGSGLLELFSMMGWVLLCVALAWGGDRLLGWR